MKKFVLPLFVLTALLAAAAARAAATLDIYWIDVEGGASTLLVTPAGESVLIDTGWAGGPGARGQSAARVHAAAVQAGLTKIDYLILTHFHSDHFGGAADLAKLIPIGIVLDNGIPDHDPDGAADSRRFLREIQPYRDFPAVARQVMRPGQVIPLQQAARTAPLTFYCVGARRQYPVPAFTPANPLCSQEKDRAPDTSDNANSIVMLLKFGSFRFFDGGDLTWNMEGKLVCPCNAVGTVDVYQVDHHGFEISNNPLLLRSLAPTVSVMDNGPRKGGGKATLATLRSIPTIQTMYQLHRDIRGTNDFNTDAQYIANVPENCVGNYIKCSVEPSGASYTISIPATGFARTYQTTPKKP